MDLELNDDWEVLSDHETNNSYDQNPTLYLEGGGIIQPDYFSLDAHNKYVPDGDLSDVSDRVSVVSDNPSWIDPVVCDGTSYSRTKPVGEQWTSTDESSDDGKYIESDMNSVENDVVGEVEANGTAVEAVREEVVAKDVERKDVDVVAVWWKLPLDLLKYCLFKASPVWTLSVAAAMMGVVILGRRLYKMKHKTRTLQLKIAMDDKKVSQVMNRAARLNEAFSVVKRSPIIRPSLPAPGITPWPMMALR